MSSDLKFENILSRVREQLNEDKIKLWLPPYLTESDNDDNQETLFNVSKCEELIKASSLW